MKNQHGQVVQTLGRKESLTRSGAQDGKTQNRLQVAMRPLPRARADRSQEQEGQPVDVISKLPLLPYTYLVEMAEL